MASLGNLTYNITVNDEVTKELEKLQLTVNDLQNRVFLLEQFSIKTQLDNEGRFVISGATGEMIAKYVEDKYKEMLAQQPTN